MHIHQSSSVIICFIGFKLLIFVFLEINKKPEIQPKNNANDEELLINTTSLDLWCTTDLYDCSSQRSDGIKQLLSR